MPCAGDEKGTVCLCKAQQWVAIRARNEWIACSCLLPVQEWHRGKQSAACRSGRLFLLFRTYFWVQRSLLPTAGMLCNPASNSYPKHHAFMIQNIQCVHTSRIEVSGPFHLDFAKLSSSLSLRDAQGYKTKGSNFFYRLRSICKRPSHL